MGPAAEALPPVSRRRRRLPRLRDGCDRRSIPIQRGPNESTVRSRSHAARADLPLVRRTLGLRSGPATQVERDPKYLQGHTVAQQLLACAIQGPRVEPLDLARAPTQPHVSVT